MLTLVATSGSGWVLLAALAATIAVPFALRHRSGRDAVQRPLRQRLRPHYWLGYVIAALALVHAGLATGSGLALHANATGVSLATAALVLVGAQVCLGVLLREPSVRNRPALRRRHRWVMVGIVAVTVGHIVLNSPLVHGLIGR